MTAFAFTELFGGAVYQIDDLDSTSIAMIGGAALSAPSGPARDAQGTVTVAAMTGHQIRPSWVDPADDAIAPPQEPQAAMVIPPAPPLNRLRGHGQQAHPSVPSGRSVGAASLHGGATMETMSSPLMAAPRSGSGSRG